MKREIKFRAWVKKENSMVDITCIDWTKQESQPNGWCACSWEDGFNESVDTQEKDCVFPLDQVELMQFTGLLDKDGKEIYENDYLEIPEVSDNSKTWCVFWGSGKYILQNISTGDILDCNETNTNKKEGGGNRYENPREHKAVASDL